MIPVYFLHLDVTPTIKDWLLQISSKDDTSVEKPHLGFILNIIGKHLEGKKSNSIGVDLLDLFTWYYCTNYFFPVPSIIVLRFSSSLKIPLINENKVVRTAGLRVIRLCIQDERSVEVMIKANLHHFIAK